MFSIKEYEKEPPESHAGPPLSDHEDFKDKVAKSQRQQQAEKELRGKLENGRSDKEEQKKKNWRKQEHERDEASNKVGPQSLNMRCDKVDQVTARKSDLSV